MSPIFAALDLAGWGAVLGGLALLVGSLTAAYSTIVAANRIKAMAPVIAVIPEAIQATHDKVVEIDKAVNGKELGAQSMVSQVDDLHKEIPVPIPVQTTGEAILPLVRALVEDMNARREKEQRDNVT